MLRQFQLRKIVQDTEINISLFYFQVKLAIVFAKEYLDKKKKILIKDKTIDRSMISIIDITQKRYRRLLSKKDMLRIIKKRKVSKYGNLLFTI